jgi:UDP-glucose 4-epimerase
MAATVLITGANGFIGTHATHLFESLGHKVVPIDIFPRSSDLALVPIKTTSYELDVTNSGPFHELCQAQNVTHIFHAAHPRREENPTVLDFCYHAMTNILETAKELKVQRVVYSSSGALYGQVRKKDHSPIREDDPVSIYPTYFYRSAKILSEWLGDFYKEQYGVPFVALRYSSVYGPGLGRGIPLELKKGILGQKCRPYLTRLPDDVVYVDDVTDAVRRALFTVNPLSRAYNIALDKAYGNEELKQAIHRALPELSFEIGKHPNAATTGPHRDRDVLDISLAKQELGWAPTIDLYEGIARLATWLANHKAVLER